MPEVSVAVLPGDGIGPEVVAEARRVVDAIAPDHGLVVDWHDHLVGGISIDAEGTALTDEVLEACRASDAVLLGAVGGPQWDTTDPGRPRPEQGLLGLRSGLGLYANLRPVRPWAGPLRRQPPAAGAHRGHRPPGGARAHRRPLLRRAARPRDATMRAFNTLRLHARDEVAPLADVALRRARGAPAQASPRWTRPTCSRPRACGARRSIEVAARVSRTSSSSTCSSTRRHAAVAAPRRFDVIVTENLFGDILSDEAAMITGSIGMLPSASPRRRHARPLRAGARLGARHRRPGHRQPDRDVLSAAMMLRYSLGAPEAADRIDAGRRRCPAPRATAPATSAATRAPGRWAT